jgi:DNA mismatch repair protein MutS
VDGASSECGMLVYGVNASGKSSLGKAIGLAVLMAQCGMPVPATSMKLIPYNAIYTRILGNDNLWAGMSSFVVEMTEFRSILRSANRRVLVVGDELCAGTETASATAIVAAGIQTLIKRGCHFFFATHLHELVDIPEISSNRQVSIFHLSVKPNLENGSLLYDRHLRHGCGSPMYGLEVCRGLDMDSEFLTLAYDLRTRLFRSDGKAHSSRYNADVVVSKCEICGSREALETHHIIPQASATATGRIGPGKHKNSKDNLVVLCDSCHTKHHNGDLDIQGWILSSVGKQIVTSSSH